MKQSKQSEAISSFKRTEKEINRLTSAINSCRKALNLMAENPDSIELNGAFVADEEKIAKAFKRARSEAEKQGKDNFTFGTYKGIEITVDLISNGPKKMPSLAGYMNVDGNERQIIECLYNNVFAKKVLNLDEDFKAVINDCDTRITQEKSNLENYERLSQISFDKNDELSQLLARQVELQSALVEAANNSVDIEEEKSWEELTKGTTHNKSEQEQDLSMTDLF
jgi:hypothetical protein